MHLTLDYINPMAFEKKLLGNQLRRTVQRDQNHVRKLSHNYFA